MGRDTGLTPAKLAAIANWQESDAYDGLERDVLALADALADTPSHVEESLFSSLQLKLGKRGLVELTNAITWENMRARGNRVFDAQSENYYDGALCLLPPRAA